MAWRRDLFEAAVLAFNAGVDIDMTSNAFIDGIAGRC